jgi:hypothetical protein
MRVNVDISPTPTDDEVAAIVAAVEALWPKPVFIESSPVLRVPTWRFSNRWWTKPLALRRERPRH